MNNGWYYAIDGHAYGPCSLQEIERLKAVGTIRQCDYIRHTEQPDWTMVGNSVGYRTSETRSQSTGEGQESLDDLAQAARESSGSPHPRWHRGGNRRHTGGFIAIVIVAIACIAAIFYWRGGRDRSFRNEQAANEARSYLNERLKDWERGEVEGNDAVPVAYVLDTPHLISHEITFCTTTADLSNVKGSTIHVQYFKAIVNLQLESRTGGPTVRQYKYLLQRDPDTEKWMIESGYGSPN